jgi:hypothetical protein
MIAIREIKSIENNKISIDIPLDFPSKDVEVIVLPIIKNSNNNTKKLPDLIDIDKSNYASEIVLRDRR